MRFGQRVEVEGERIVADYVSRTVRHRVGIDVFAWTTPPLQGGTYYIAVSNRGPGEVNYKVSAGYYGFIDFAGPVIFRAEVKDEKLLLYGLFILHGGKLYLNGKKQKQVVKDEQHPGCLIIGERAGKKIAPGETVTLQLKFCGGLRTPEFEFTRPEQ